MNSMRSAIVIWASRFSKRPLFTRQHGQWYAVARDSRGVPRAGAGRNREAARRNVVGIIAAVERAYGNAS